MSVREAKQLLNEVILYQQGRLANGIIPGTNGLEAFEACLAALNGKPDALRVYLGAEIPPELQSRSTKPKKPPLLRDQAAIEKVLQRLDIEAFQSQYPSVPVDEVFQEFWDYCTLGTPRKPWPNPSDYRDFNMAFHNWCKRRAKQTQKGRGPYPGNRNVKEEFLRKGRNK